jgi:phosphatidylserine decarboxylase
MDHDDEDYTRISIFLSVFDVHVNRIPFSGTITQKVYRPGKFLNAALDKASLDNEMCALAMKVEHEGKTKEMAFCQIAGWVARRIVTNIEEGQTVKAGQELGIIRFGSRMDVYLPKGVAPQVIVGQRVIEGETVLADFSSKKAARDGESRGQN